MLTAMSGVVSASQICCLYCSMKEEWRDIKGYEGKYQVSNLGNVRSMNYHRKEGCVRLLIPNESNENGYPYVILAKEKGKYKSLKIHRLVAEAFIPNPQNKPVVNHKDGNKKNNCVSNLEWMTILENNLHAYHVLNKHPMRGYKFDKNKNSKKVAQYYVSEEGYTYLLATYVSVKAAALINNLKDTSITQCCKGNKMYGQVGGYIWKYVENV